MRKHYPIYLLALLFASCTFFSQEPTVPPRRAHKIHRTVPMQIEGLNPQKDVTDIEVIWAPPTETVDSFVINYGFKEDELSEHITTPAEDVEIISDEKLGNVMHFIIQDVPDTKTLYITVDAIKDGSIFSTSDIFVSEP